MPGFAGELAMRGMRAVGKSVVEESMAIFQRNSSMLPMLTPNAGWLVLFAMIDAIWRDAPNDRRFATIARTCDVSQPHVKTVLATARDYGLLEEVTPGLFAPTETMWQNTLVWIADCLAASIACCRLAAQTQAGTEAASPAPDVIMPTE